MLAASEIFVYCSQVPRGVDQSTQYKDMNVDMCFASKIKSCYAHACEKQIQIVRGLSGSSHFIFSSVQVRHKWLVNLKCDMAIIRYVSEKQCLPRRKLLEHLSASKHLGVHFKKQKTDRVAFENISTALWAFSYKKKRKRSCIKGAVERWKKMRRWANLRYLFYFFVFLLFFASMVLVPQSTLIWMTLPRIHWKFRKRLDDSALK